MKIDIWIFEAADVADGFRVAPDSPKGRAWLKKYRKDNARSLDIGLVGSSLMVDRPALGSLVWAAIEDRIGVKVGGSGAPKLYPEDKKHWAGRLD